MRSLGIIGILFLFFACETRASEKVDTIYFRNGDRMTGEVKALQNNYLRLKTHDASTIQIKWNRIDSVKIMNNMRIELKDGQVLYGKLLPAGEIKACFIWGSIGVPRFTPLAEVVALSPMEEKFIDRLKGTLSSGFSYAKATDLTQLNLNGQLTYLARKNQLELSYDGNFTRQDTLSSNQNQNGGINFQRLLARNWFVVSNLNMETNSELKLDLRTSFGAGGGKYLVRSNKSSFYMAGGLQGNRELAKGNSQNNLEALFVSNYSVYIYDSPELSFNLSLDVLPSLTNAGRFRTNINSNLKWEIFGDFYLKWTFYYTYDSRPLTEGAAKSDWAITLLGVEYKFK